MTTHHMLRFARRWPGPPNGQRHRETVRAVVAAVLSARERRVNVRAVAAAVLSPRWYRVTVVSPRRVSIASKPAAG